MRRNARAAGALLLFMTALPAPEARADAARPAPPREGEAWQKAAAERTVTQGKWLVVAGVVTLALSAGITYYAMNRCEAHAPEDQDGCWVGELAGTLFVGTPVLAAGAVLTVNGALRWRAGRQAVRAADARSAVSVFPISGGAVVGVGGTF